MWGRSVVCASMLSVAFVGACADDDGEGLDATQGMTTAATSTTEGSDATGETGDEVTDDTTSGETGPGVVDYASDVQPIWNGNCTCHLQGPSGTMTATVLTLNPDASYDELVGVPSEQVPEMDRVTGGDPDQSYLWHKLQNTHLEVGGMGTSMPQGLQLGAEDLAVIEAWIAAGAEP